MSSAPDAAGPQMAGFKDFYQFLAPTRVIAGRGLIEGIGFEFAKEGAARVLVVTDQVIRGTGLIDKVEAGVATAASRSPGCSTTCRRTRARTWSRRAPRRRARTAPTRSSPSAAAR